MKSDMWASHNTYDLETKTVTSAGNSGAVYLPKAWIGCKVQVLLIEPLDN